MLLDFFEFDNTREHVRTLACTCMSVSVYCSTRVSTHAYTPGIHVCSVHCKLCTGLCTYNMNIAVK